MIKHLEWDTAFFGYPVAAIDLMDSNNVDLVKTIAQLKKDNYRLVYLRINPSFKEANLIAVDCGGALYDEKTTYGKTIISQEWENEPNIQSYQLDKPTEELYKIAIQTGEYSRYKKDTNFTEIQFNQLYRIWIENSVLRENAEEVLVYGIENKQVGLVTLSRNEKAGVIGLIGVDYQLRGQRIGMKLVQQTEAYFNKLGVNYLTVVTQKANIPACKFYEKCGFEVIKVENIYHLWL